MSKIINLEQSCLSKRDLDNLPEGYPIIDPITDQDMASSSKKSSFLGNLRDDISLVLETGMCRDHEEGSDQDHDKASKSSASNPNIDPRLLLLLEFFRQLYIRKKGMFKKTFPYFHDEFVDQMLKKIGALSSADRSEKKEGKTMQRSLSVGSPQPRSIGEDESPLRHQRFKVRTVVPGSGGGGQGDTVKSSGTKSK